MKQVDQEQPKTREVDDLRNPEMKAAERRGGQQRSPKLNPTPTAIHIRFLSMSLAEQQNSERGR